MPPARFGRPSGPPTGSERWSVEELRQALREASTKAELRAALARAGEYLRAHRGEPDTEGLIASIHMAGMQLDR